MFRCKMIHPHKIYFYNIGWNSHVRTYTRSYYGKSCHGRFVQP